MPRYDFMCDNGHVRTDVWVSLFNVEHQRPIDISPCEQCNMPMKKLACAPNFTVSGFNAANGYSKSS